MADTVTRALTVPVAGPLHITWDELRPELNAALRDAMTVANTAMRAYYTHDGPRLLPSDAQGKCKLSPFSDPGTAVYAACRAAAPDMPTASLSSITQDIRGKYRAARLALAQGKQSLPTFRFGYPVPLKAGAFRIELDDDGAVVVRCQLGVVDRKHPARLRLGGGHRFARDRRVLVDVLTQRLKQRTGYLLQNGKGQLLFKLVYDRPRTPPRAGAAGTLLVASTPAALLVARLAGCDRDVYVAHRDDVARRILAAIRIQQRLSDDAWYEARPGIYPAMTQRAARERAWLATQIHNLAHRVVSLAARRRCAGLYLDTEYRDGLPRFPWFTLAERIRQKCEEFGVAFMTSCDAAAAAQITQLRAEVADVD